MRLFVNDFPVYLPAGMKVRHALIAAGLADATGAAKSAYDEWGNLLGLDGALSDGMRIYVK
jgi:hypothetical protein